MKNPHLILTLLLILGHLPARGAHSSPSLAALNLQSEKIADGLAIPWGMVFITPGELLIAEKNGKFRILNVQTKKLTAVRGGIEVFDDGQGGLLDVALGADFARSGIIYYTYAKKMKDGATTALGRARLRNGSLTDARDLFTAEPVKKGNMHFGSRLVVTDKEIFMTVGERNDRHEAQKLESHLGKLLRLDHDGKAMKDNPFVKDPKARKEIYSYGHRNAQGLLRHPVTGEIWVQEHGPRGGDELNRIQAGKNYGWPVITFGREYWGPKIGEGTSKAGMESPVYQWTPSIAPCGFAFYDGDKIPALKNHFLSGALKLTHLNAVDLTKKDSEKRLLEKEGFRVREIEISADGLIYFSTDEGEIYRLSPSRG